MRHKLDNSKAYGNDCSDKPDLHDHPVVFRLGDAVCCSTGIAVGDDCSKGCEVYKPDQGIAPQERDKDEEEEALLSA